MKQYTRINNQIRAPELRVIDEDGESLGTISLSQALARAEEAGLDLIEISPNAVPPVAKIMEYGKYQYIQQKKEKEARAKSHSTETKSLQVKIGTGDKDLEIKAGKAAEFLKEGHRIKIDLFLPGRSKYFKPEFLTERLERLLRLIPEDFKIADPAKRSPKGMTVVIERQTAKGSKEGTNKPGEQPNQA